MWRELFSCTLLLLAARSVASATKPRKPKGGWRLLTLDPGHFHAALIHKQAYPQISPRVFVYAPLGPDLLAHLARIHQFNSRPDNPTAWELEIYAAPDFFERMLADRRGHIVVLSGRNRGKIRRIQACLEAGLHVLADKPWILDSGELPQLEKAFRTAQRRRVLAFDIMTERFEVTNMLQRELVQDREIFGTIEPGSESSPAVVMESVHHICKTVAGAPLLRPASFFDIEEQGEGLTDVGTHLVDLVQWILFPDQALDWRKDVAVLGGKRWPEVLTREQFSRVTAVADFPEKLRPWIKDGSLEYYCNNQVNYRLRGVHVRLDVLWRYEAPPGAGDTHYAVFRGTRSRVEIRQGKAENYRPELYLIPNRPEDGEAVRAALARRIEQLRPRYPGIGLAERDGQLWVTIPDALRVGHEAHFGQVVEQFLHYLADPARLPAWEAFNMLVKYAITTQGVALARKSPAGRTQ
ncbi:MAG: putative oxidoreductase C-terminal domain-containing protein [Bryobacteraceae bacterium]